MTLLLGIDVGTSSIKAVAKDPGTGQVVAFSRQPTSTHHPRPDWSEPGSAGAMWLPHLIGSGTPQADESSRAALVGLRPEHDRGHVLRAMLEGLAYRLRQNLEVAEANLPTVASGEVLAIGGATRSPFWTQLKADVTGRPFRVPRLVESVALGAALWAGVGAGVFADSEAAVRSLRVASDCFEPDVEAAMDYRRRYDAVYRRLYPSLREVSAAIEALQHA